MERDLVVYVGAPLILFNQPWVFNTNTDKLLPGLNKFKKKKVFCQSQLTITVQTTGKWNEVASLTFSASLSSILSIVSMECLSKKQR